MDKKIINDLKKSLKTFKEQDNPKLYNFIKEYTRGSESYFYDYLSLAIEIDSIDMTYQLPEEVFRILVDLYLRAAESGDPEEKGLAYNNLGALHYNERSGNKDAAKSLEYYKKADEYGDVTAASNLGYAYYYGNGTEIDYEKAYYYFSKAALAGSTEAMYKLGDMFRYGYYVAKDENMTRIAYIKSEHYLQQGEPQFIPSKGKVYLRLGDMYFEGIGTAIDYDKAYECYQRAERGFYEMIRMGDIYSDGSLKLAIERQAEIREMLDKELPKTEWAKRF